MRAKAIRQQTSQAEQRTVPTQRGFVAQTLTGPTGALLGVQQSHGNRFVQRWLAACVLQRACACGGTCLDCSAKRSHQDHGEIDRVDRKSTAELASSSVPPAVYEALGSPGQPLDASTRAFVEPRFGRDFQHVRVHTGTKAAESAKAVNALAYTVGQDIVFAAGQYNPASHQGQRLLAHELAHTVQQAGAGPGPISAISAPDDSSEREAESVADQVMRMPDAGAPSIDEVRVEPLQRMCTQCAEEDKDRGLPRAETMDNSDQEEMAGAGVDTDMPVLRPPAEALAEVQEEQAHSPIVRARGMTQPTHARGWFAAGASLATRAVAAMAFQPRVRAPGVLQRWSTDGPADKGTNTIVCDGSGGIRVQVSTGNDPNGFKCVGDCVIKHEQSHRADALAADPRVCKRWYWSDYDDGTQVTMDASEQKPSEIKASQVEIDCLDAKLPTASNECKPWIESRRKVMVAYRDSFK